MSRVSYTRANQHHHHQHHHRHDHYHHDHHTHHNHHHCHHDPVRRLFQTRPGSKSSRSDHHTAATFLVLAVGHSHPGLGLSFRSFLYISADCQAMSSLTSEGGDGQRYLDPGDLQSAIARLQVSQSMWDRSSGLSMPFARCALSTVFRSITHSRVRASSSLQGILNYEGNRSGIAEIDTKNRKH